SSRRRHTRFSRDWSSDVCSSDLVDGGRNTYLAWNHRRFKGGESYFIANQDSVARSPRISFRDTAPFVYVYDAVTDKLAPLASERSEERRVGKEWRSRWWPSQCKR